jgi:hypothetical protein
MLVNIETVHAAAELHFDPGASRPLRYRAVELTLIQHLGERNLRAVLKCPSSKRDGLNGPDVRQNGIRREIEAPESLVAKDTRADGPLADPVLGLEENDV